AEDDRLDVRIFANTVDLLLHEAVGVENRPLDADDGDLVGRLLAEGVVLFLRDVGRTEILLVASILPDDDHHADAQQHQQELAGTAERWGRLLLDDRRGRAPLPGVRSGSGRTSRHRSASWPLRWRRNGSGNPLFYCTGGAAAYRNVEAAPEVARLVAAW